MRRVPFQLHGSFAIENRVVGAGDSTAQGVPWLLEGISVRRSTVHHTQPLETQIAQPDD